MDASVWSNATEWMDNAVMRSPHFVLSLALASKTALALAGETLPKLELQDVNFVHTSDIHSWYRGHQKTDDLSRSWNANIGDVASFVHHMKQQAEAQGKDLFFVNSGDDTHGGGLSDSDNPEGSKALAIHAMLPYDVMTPGNHELEDPKVALNLYRNITSRYPDKYLASNVNIVNEYNRTVPLGERYRTWTTRGGKRNVAALGVSFENSKTKDAKDANVAIQPIEEMIKEEWFVKGFLGSNPDIFLLVGHMSISDGADKWDDIHKAIRNFERAGNLTHKPIFIFAGHSHKRDCRMNFNDTRSIALESGRYLETVGWVSATLPEYPEPPKFVRRYLDPSKDTFLRHSGVDQKSFDTEMGNEVMHLFNKLAEERGLNEVYGCAPHTYNWDHEKYTKDAKDHVLNFYMNEVFPDVINTKNAMTGEPNPYFLLLNNGFMRGPIYQGKFTKDDKFVNLPYKQPFVNIRLPRLISERVLEMIDLQTKADYAVTDLETASRSGVDQTVFSANEQAGSPLTLGRYLRKEIVGRLTATSPGYVTEDRCGQLGPGDDTVHSSPGLKIQLPPNYVHSRSSTIEKLDQYDLVDLVLLDRLKKRVHKMVNEAIELHNASCEKSLVLCEHIAIVKEGDWKPYGNVDSSDAIMEYARKHWTCLP